MASVNKVILIGGLGKDVEVRYMPSGDAMANLSLATTDTWKDKGGEKQERTEWHRVVIFGKQAEIAGKYLQKGSQVYIEGRLQTRKWTDKSNVDHYTTEIVADRMQMLGGKSGGSSGGYSRQEIEQVISEMSPEQRENLLKTLNGSSSKPDSQNKSNQSGWDDFEDSIPF